MSSEAEHIKICTGCGTLESKPRDRHCCPDMRFKSFNELNIELERCKNRLFDSNRATEAIFELQGQVNAYHGEFIRALRRAEKAEAENKLFRAWLDAVVDFQYWDEKNIDARSNYEEHRNKKAD